MKQKPPRYYYKQFINSAPHRVASSHTSSPPYL